ncbi:MAG: PAS domain S-box protein [Bacteroidales bacterium]|nr:PAS domain S-box protein [Bacteroidales bacterium]MBN2755869.1 PAS domain S-box protein [Bacteroidales bacterium]
MKENPSHIDFFEKYKQAQIELEKLKKEIADLKKKERNEPVLFKDSFNLEESIKTFGDLLPFVVSILDQNGNFIYVNSFGLNFFGYTCDDFNKGLNISKILANLEDIVRFSSKFENKTGKEQFPKASEYLLKKSDETTFYGLVYSETLINYDGKELMLGIVIDHTEYRRVTENYICAEENLRQLNATKDKFFSIIAHDLKNPFSAIIGFSELILNNVSNYSKEQIESFVTVINKASIKGYTLLENLLEWSRNQTGKVDVIKEKFEINELIKENIELIKEKADLKGIKIIYKNETELYAEADKNMINTVIRNLLSNAIKYTKHKGTVEIKAEKSCKTQSQKNECLKIEISDNGIGIENENIHKLFKIEESYSTKGTSSEKGTGLGLILCKDFVEKNNGEIWVESEFGKGSSFYFTLPFNN